MLSNVFSAAIRGLDGYIVNVQVDISSGLPCFATVGLPDRSITESKDRVTAAIKNSGFEYPMRKITVNLAPADIRKEGAGFDLPIAVGILAAAGAVRPELLQEYILVGELALDGTLRDIKGALSMAVSLRELKIHGAVKSDERSKLEKIKGMVIPAKNARESAMIDGTEVIPVKTLKETVQFLNGEINISPCSADTSAIFTRMDEYDSDYSDVKGQGFAKRAIEVAAAGGHNVIMVGPPGSGKTMMAKRIPTVLPVMNFDEAMETTRIHSVAGRLAPSEGILVTRPFRSPHHTVSDVALIGGGAFPKPGEVSLAHNGVLFLDELPEFHRNVIEVLRQPLEEGFVSIARAQQSITLPADFMLVAAMNPCPCGYYGHYEKECVCSSFKIQKYLSKVSGPLLDRIDIHLEVPAVTIAELTEDFAHGEGDSDSPAAPDLYCSSAIRERVEKARVIQQERFTQWNSAAKKKVWTNAKMTSKMIKDFCRIDAPSRKLLRQAVEKLGLSARGCDKILKVARTIADVAGKRDIEPQDIAEAVQYRSLDRRLL